MQYTADQLNIRLLNEDADSDLLEQADPQGANLNAVLRARSTLGELQCAGLGRVELREIVEPFGAALGLRIEGEAAATAELVLEGCASMRSWIRIRKFYDTITKGKGVSQPFAPMHPWLCVAFLPDLYRRLTTAQRATAIALLWGRAYQLRRQARAGVPLN